MTSSVETDLSTQVYTLYVKASPEEIWAAITEPEWTVRYGYAAPAQYELRPGGAYRVAASPEMAAHGSPETIIDGEVLEVEAPRRLVQTWNPLFGPPVADEPATRLTWELETAGDQGTRLTLTHELEGAPMTAGLVAGAVPEMGGGWAFMLGDLKTLLESGDARPGTGRKLFVNLAVADLARSVEFFTALGFTFDRRFTDEHATCMIVGGDAFVMLLVRDRFGDFVQKEIADSATHTEAIMAVSAGSREEVDRLADAALGVGGQRAQDPTDLGFMYGRSFYDPDGHLWEAFWMDEAAAEGAAQGQD
jgi:predicted lactoylglutathione lyase/uncharacterized protein YndB with AHSA1/START domain